MDEQSDATSWRLVLSHEMRWKYYAHLLTYMVYRTIDLKEQVSPQTLETLKGVGNRLFGLCMQPERGGMPLLLSEKDAHALMHTFHRLAQRYAADPLSENRDLALQDVAECLALLQEEKQQP